MIQTDTKAPGFELPDQHGNRVALSDFAGEWVVLYFYPKAMTPGCTAEACSFQNRYDEFRSRDVAVVGVSTDPVDELMQFVTAEDLEFTLLSDEDGTVASQYGSFGKREHDGKTWEIALRNTFLIGPDGQIKRTYESVSPDEHVQEVLADIEALRE